MNDRAALFLRMVELLGTVELSWSFTERERIVTGWHQIEDEARRIADEIRAEAR